jgi:hypothetical protein
MSAEIGRRRFWVAQRFPRCDKDFALIAALAAEVLSQN